MAWCADNFNLSDDKDLEAFIEKAKQTSVWLSATFGVPLGMITIDTVVKAFTLPEEGNADITDTCKRLERIRDAIAGFTLAVMHAGKDPSKGARGGSAWRGDVDVTLMAVGDRSETKGTCENRQLALSKNRFGPEGPISGFDLKIIELGVDEDDEPFDAAVIVPNDKTMPVPRSSKPPRYYDQFEQAFYNTVLAKSVARRIPAPAGVESVTVKAAKVSDVKKPFYDRLTGIGQDGKRMAFNRLLEGLFKEFPQETDGDGEWIWSAKAQKS